MKEPAELTAHRLVFSPRACTRDRGNGGDADCHATLANAIGALRHGAPLATDAVLPAAAATAAAGRHAIRSDSTVATTEHLW
ncbi:MAG: hypothetical protein NTW96_04545 [Planctomycetia bacterium]|nr:hypothetical protein [Planctomycetia bacterium]